MLESKLATPVALVPAARQTISAAGFPDTLMFAADVILPTIAKGVILRRPRVMAVAELLDLDRRAIRRVQHLRRRYGTGPLHFRIFGRDIALILKPEHVHRVLSGTPDPF